METVEGWEAAGGRQPVEGAAAAAGGGSGRRLNPGDGSPIGRLEPRPSLLFQSPSIKEPPPARLEHTVCERVAERRALVRRLSVCEREAAAAAAVAQVEAAEEGGQTRHTDREEVAATSRPGEGRGKLPSFRWARTPDRSESPSDGSHNEKPG